VERAAAGIAGASSAWRIAPVCGDLLSPVDSDRTRKALAPRRDASAAPRVLLRLIAP
jgi:hypothetical protein